MLDYSQPHISCPTRRGHALDHSHCQRIYAHCQRIHARCQRIYAIYRLVQLTHLNMSKKFRNVVIYHIENEIEIEVKIHFYKQRESRNNNPTCTIKTHATSEMDAFIEIGFCCFAACRNRKSN